MTISQTTFNASNKRWFNLLKKLTKYHNYTKKHGSIANSCMEDGSIKTG